MIPRIPNCKSYLELKILKGLLPMLFELFETIVRLRLERDKWKDVFVRIFRGQFEICSFRLGIFWPQSAPHSTDTALHTLISIYCGFKHN